VKQRNILLLIQPAYPERINGIARFAKSHGWHLTIVDRLARFPRGWKGDGALVTLRGNKMTNRFVLGLSRSGIPVVDLTFNHPEIRLPRVSGDHEAFGRMARQHYESLNFRNFAWFSTTWSHVHELRCRGFAPSLKWVFDEMVGDSAVDNWPIFLRTIGRQLKNAPKPLAILAYDDADAARVLSAALEQGLRVPEDVAIMGIGNDTVICENQEVPLSSVNHDLDTNGYEGAAMLERLMKRGGKASVPTKLIPPRGIVIRKSTDTLSADNQTLSSALKAISERIHRSFGINEIADAVGLSRTALDRLFAEHFSHSVGREIARQRISRAQKMLVDSDRPMKEIAALCGYCNAGHFTNAFRSATSLSPKEWRKRNIKT